LLRRNEAAYTAHDLPRHRSAGEPGTGESARSMDCEGTARREETAEFAVVILARNQAMQLTRKQHEYWSKNLRTTAILLFIWFIATFVVGFFARDLSFNFFGWPFAFYMAAQGSLIIYVIIIWYYARYMNNLDRVYDVHEGEED
jgi:putative solute:sodium symporter small subunit